MDLDQLLAPGISYRNVRDAMRRAYRFGGYGENFARQVIIESLGEALRLRDEPIHYAPVLLIKQPMTPWQVDIQKDHADLIPSISEDDVERLLSSHGLMQRSPIFGYQELEAGSRLRRDPNVSPISPHCAIELIKGIVAEADRFNMKKGPAVYISDIYLLGFPRNVPIESIHLLVAFERRIEHRSKGGGRPSDYLARANKRAGTLRARRVFDMERVLEYAEEEPARCLLAYSKRVAIRHYIRRSTVGDLEMDCDTTSRLVYRFDSPLIMDMNERRRVEDECEKAKSLVESLV